MRKRIKTLTVSMLMVATLLSGCTIGDTEYVLDLNAVGRNDVLSINGEECSKEEARLYLCNYQNLYGNEYGINLWGYDFSVEEAPATLEEYVKDITILQLSNIMCMNQLAKEMDIELTKEEEELLKQVTSAYYDSLSEEELAYMELEKKELQNFYTKYAVAEKLYNTLTQGVNEEVSIDEARVISVQQIYVTTKSAANEVLEELEEGSKFIHVANSYNEAKIIETTYARGELPKDVEKAAFALDNNEVSDMIETDDGYYFFYCLSKNEVELTEKNKENIIAKRRKEQFDDVFEAFVKDSEFQLNQKVWESIIIDTSGNITTDSFFEVYNTYFHE